MTSPRILAVLFELTAENGRAGTLIAWLDEHGDSRYMKHSHPSRTLRDAKAGDVVVFKNKYLLTVVRLKPWRTTECKDETEYTWIQSAAAWEADRRAA